MPRLLLKRIVFDVKKVLMLYSENIQYAIIPWLFKRVLHLVWASKNESLIMAMRMTKVFLVHLKIRKLSLERAIFWFYAFFVKLWLLWKVHKYKWTLIVICKNSGPIWINLYLPRITFCSPLTSSQKTCSAFDGLHQCTMCILGTMFSFQPNKLRHILKVVSW